MKSKSLFSKYGYCWVTLFLFFFSLLGHWVFAWFAYVDTARAHAQPVVVRAYVIQTLRDTLENWQSEFLQLLWQVGGLTFLFFVGSPQSREGDDRKEAKLDLILKKLDPHNADRLLQELEEQYPKR